jgi:hypothetical protein
MRVHVSEQRHGTTSQYCALVVFLDAIMSRRCGHPSRPLDFRWWDAAELCTSCTHSGPNP